MKLDKNQVPQVVALGVLLLICICYVGIKFTKKPAVPAQPPTSASQTQTPSQTEDGAVKGPESSTPLDQLLEQQMAALSQVKQRDPFAPQLMAQLPHAAPPGRRASSGKRPAQRIEVPKTPPPKMASLPGFGTNMSVEPITVPVTAGDQPVTEPMDQLKVTGIIRGERNVAIIRSPDERHIVRVGQWVNEYRVDAITEDGVILVGKERRISLKLGGEKNAS